MQLFFVTSEYVCLNCTCTVCDNFKFNVIFIVADKSMLYVVHSFDCITSKKMLTILPGLPYISQVVFDVL